MRRSLIIALAASTIALAGCASVPLPAPKGEGDCLVVIRTKVQNPDHAAALRNYSFQLASGGREKPMPSSPESYMAFIVSGPDKFVSRHTNITAEGWTGAAQEDKFNLSLPYKAGYVVIASSMFVYRTWKMTDREGWYNNSFDVKMIGSEDKAKLIEELKTREGFGAWKFEE